MSATKDRVAVVVVHGIADQPAGRTVLEVARLLCHGGKDEPLYVQAELHGVLVPVAKLEPGSAPAHAEPAMPPASGEGPRRDASRRTPGAPSGFYQAQQAPPVQQAQVDEKAEQPPPQDLGLALNDYLLGRLELSESEELYESMRVSLRRRADDRAVDLYELYWADLSRLGTGGLRALSALYQLFFHLGTLAADVVDQVALSRGGPGSWRVLQRLHAWLAWLMKGPMALVQLLLLLLVVFGAAALVTPELQGQLLAAMFGVAAIGCAALGVLAWLHAASQSVRVAKLLFALAASATCLGIAIVSLRVATWVPLIYFGASALAVALAGAYLVERYARVTQGVRLLGHVLLLASVIALCLDARALLPLVSTQYEWMLTAALNVGEWLLAVGLLVWAAFTLVQIAALLLGAWLGRACDPAAKASLHTSRLALVGSSGFFAVLSLVLWSVVSFMITRGLTALDYEPVVFGSGYRSAAIFLENRVQSLGAFFTPLVFAFTLLAASAFLVLLPSLLEEISPTRNLDARGMTSAAGTWSVRLGHWLTGARHWLGKTFELLVAPGAIAGSVLYLAFVFQQFAPTTGSADDLAQWLAGPLQYFQGETLVAAGKWLAGGALTIAALGSRFTQTFGRLRVVIDAVLDIDNYFGDPPSRKPPRARIFSRYASLLRYLRERQYTRIVIVSHSQGTVISADLLRYLTVQGRLSSFVGAIPVSLVTVGSPLRDLYAERFPLLYRWMGTNAGGFESAGPSAADIGAVEWVNACRSGDYVGRFIWTPGGDAARFRIATVDAGGKTDANRSGDRSEFCLGAGGHTHYFSDDALALAVEIDRLVVAGASTRTQRGGLRTQ